MEEAKPTYSHKVIAHLVKQGLVKGVVSTNIDNLHRRSGVPDEKLAELHGNCFMEYCEKCKKEFYRDFDVTKSVVSSHLTGRKCDSCGTELKDSIIHFKESLKEETFFRGKGFGTGSKVGIVLGTSLRVRPASDLPLLSESMFVCNLQKTPHDIRSKEAIRARTDLFMYFLAKELELEIEGSNYSPPEGWEKEYEELEKASQMRGREFSRKNLQSMMTEQTKQLKPAKKGEICGEDGLEDQKIEPAAPTPMLITKCKNSAFQVVNNKVVKLVVLDCENVNISISGRILTGVLELINCKKVNVCFQKSCPTIQIDNSQDITLGFVEISLFDKIVSSGNSSLKVAPALNREPISIEFVGIEKEAEKDRPMLQYMTHIVGPNMVTEKVVREGNGYATTKREKEAADAKDERNRLLLEKHFASMISIKQKSDD